MEDQDPPTENGELTDTQWIVINVLRFCSASLSIIGSCLVLLKIIRDRTINGSMMPYDRIILGMSSCDILLSITTAIDPFLLPSETSTRAWAFGNDTTCQAAGFLSQLSLSSWWYNCILSFYFLLTVLSQAHQKNYVRKWELSLHLSVLFFPVTAIIGLRRGWYSEEEMGLCFLPDARIKWIFVGVPNLIIYFSLIFNNIAIYAVVRKALQSSEQVTGLTPVQKRVKREATTLMFLYITSFYVTLTPTFIKAVLEANFGFTKDDTGRIYPLLILAAITYPLQGFFNFLIYIRPMYIRFRASNPNKPMRFVLHEALFNPNVPQLSYSNDDRGSEVTANPNEVLFDSNFRPSSTSSNWFSSREISSNALTKGEGGISSSRQLSSSRRFSSRDRPSNTIEEGDEKGILDGNSEEEAKEED